MNPATETAIETPPELDLENIRFDPSWALRLPPSLLVRRRVLPLLVLDGHLYVATTGDLDNSTRRVMERLAGHPVRPVRAAGASLRAVQVRLFGDLNKALTQNAPPLEINDLRKQRDIQAEDLGELCQSLLKGAVFRRASDIHFNVDRDGTVQVRLRVDGELNEFMSFPAELRTALFNRFKVMARMDIAEKRAPQDGAFRFDPGAGFNPVEVRAATIPSRHGERLTLRLLGLDTGSLTLGKLGMNADQRALFEQAINLPHGMVLLTGPTGSGKSTTLYAGLRHLLQGRRRNIMTVEDPVEYDIDGVIQTEVDRRGEKVSFASSLRSILRHDPDVIMIGEIRDRETADLAVRAALTGHLVLSTLHTNSALGAVTRLLDLGIDRFLLASVLRLVAAQRLVRNLCPKCRTEACLGRAEALLLRDAGLAGRTVYQPKGCLHCGGDGYTGRLALFECVPIDADMGRALGRGAHEDDEAGLRAMADEKGYTPLRGDGLEKLLTGRVTLSDLLTAVMEF